LEGDLDKISPINFPDKEVATRPGSDTGVDTPFQGYSTQASTPVATQPDCLETIESQRNLSHQNEKTKNGAGEKKKRAF